MRFYFQVWLWLACAATAGAQVATNATAEAAGTNIVVTAGSGYVLDDKHLLEPGDKLSFQILEDRDPPRSLTVADSRELDVPYVGRVAVADRTCKQLAKELKVLLEKEYYYRATVIVGLDSVNKVRGKIYVIGQVRNQGTVDVLFNENLTAGKAILRAGGFGDFANKKRVKVLRGGNGNAGSAKQTFEVNMVEVLEEGKTEKDVVLEPDDFIIVPARAVSF
jgi:protein involved in polysaccharide export with SLBB domain